jgi:hypothetical protein
VSSNTLYITFKESSSAPVSKIVQALKYLFTIKRFLQGLVADDSVFSYHLPFLAEAAYDLECSLILVEAGYFKQSLQTLRNVIESILTHAYFALKDLDYEELLLEDNYKTPTFKEMITFLRNENIFTTKLEQEYFRSTDFLVAQCIQK